jgi:hypothetical protein
MRTICRPQSTLGQLVLSGSWWYSSRRRCSGSGWRRGLRGGVRRGRRRRAFLGFGLLQLRLQAGLVLGKCLLKQVPLLGTHRLGLGAELPGFELRQLQGDLLDLGVLELDLAVLLANALQRKRLGTAP